MDNTFDINVKVGTNMYSKIGNINTEVENAYKEFIDNSTTSFEDHRKELEQVGEKNCKVSVEWDDEKVVVIDDGLMEVEVNRSTTLLTFVIMYQFFKDGRHVTNAFCRRRMKFRSARHVEISSKSLIYLCVDGETVASRHFEINVIDKAVTLRLPALRKEE